MLAGFETDSLDPPVERLWVDGAIPCPNGETPAYEVDKFDETSKETFRFFPEACRPSSATLLVVEIAGVDSFVEVASALFAEAICC